MSFARPLSYYPAAGYLRPRNTPRAVAATLAALAAAAVVGTWWFFVNRGAGQRVERWALAGRNPQWLGLDLGAAGALDAVSVGLVVTATVVAILIAVLRKRWVLALEVALMVGGANATTQLLKHYLPRPHLITGWTGPNSLPSGHTTVAASVSAAMLIVAPRRWRPLVAVLGALWTIAAGNSTIAHQWHRPSDVVAAVLVAFAWAALVCALTSRSALDVPGSPNASMAAPASYRVAGLMLVIGALFVLGGVFALVTLLQAGAVAPTGGHTRAYGGGMAGAAGATALLFGLLLLIRQATAVPRRYQVTTTGLRQYIPEPETQFAPAPQAPGLHAPEALAPQLPQAYPVAVNRMEQQWPGN